MISALYFFNAHFLYYCMSSCSVRVVFFFEKNLSICIYLLILVFSFFFPSWNNMILVPNFVNTMLKNLLLSCTYIYTHMRM